MQIIRTKVVSIRKHSNCSACYRRIEKGITMVVQTIVDQDGIGTYRMCTTCAELLTKHGDIFDNGEREFEAGCVREELKQNQTPEQLLKILNGNTTN